MSSTSQPAYGDAPSIEAIRSVDLPDSVCEVIEDYEAAGGERSRFVWHWIYDLLPEFTLSSVPASRGAEVRELKTHLTVFVTLLDDIAEKNGDGRTFEAIRRRALWPDAPELPAAEIDGDLVAFAADLWDRIDAGLRAAPRHDEFRAVFEYDLRQVLNAMDYSRVLNEHPAIANLGGARHYDAHNMVVFPYSDVDIMHSPEFERTDHGPLREQLWDLQAMARIGNWLTTWRRELREGDVSAGVVVYAIQQGFVSPADLATADEADREALIETIEDKRIEARFEAEWHQLHQQAQNREFDTESVDIAGLVEGMETVMAHHVASEGHK